MELCALVLLRRAVVNGETLVCKYVSDCVPLYAVVWWSKAWRRLAVAILPVGPLQAAFSAVLFLDWAWNWIETAL